MINSRNLMGHPAFTTAASLGKKLQISMSLLNSMELLSPGLFQIQQELKLIFYPYRRSKVIISPHTSCKMINLNLKSSKLNY